jgi:hypothetical protein
MLPMSSDLTVKDSVFRSTTYRQYMFKIEQQTIHLENLSFEDLTYKPCGCAGSGVVVIEDGNVKMEDCSFDNVEIFTSVVYARGNETDFSADGNTNTSLTVYDKENRDSGEYCEEGIVYDYDSSGTIDECIDLFSDHVDAAPGSGVYIVAVVGAFVCIMMMG